MIKQSSQFDHRSTPGRRLAVLVLSVCVVILATGCQTKQKRQVVHRDPAIPLSIGRAELVDYLNQQNRDLDGWRCMSTKLYARLPGAPDQRLSGYIACQTPQYFRLTADNLLVKADLGSNADHCWVYLKPGTAGVMKWKHEDTPLLQQIPIGVPSIDPNWLMLVLGITPLNANDYELSRSPIGKPELWLTAVEQGADGRSVRRVIKIDALQGVVREHAVYDSDANPLVRAQLSGHQRREGHLIPSHVKLMFPQTDTELSLSFNDIEPNPHLPDAYWHMPDKNINVVDIGDELRSKMAARQPSNSTGSTRSPRVRLQPPIFHQPDQTVFASPEETAFDGSATHDAAGAADIEEPDWDTPISFSRAKNQTTSHIRDRPAPPPKRRSLFSRLFSRR